jgi:energy-coupling factor transporter ATP-binding protein EcfA2
MRPFVELEGVGVSYGEVRVLDGINLTVEPGDFLGIIGPNGSGKTTLLRVMLGLLEPQEGRAALRPAAGLIPRVAQGRLCSPEGRARPFAAGDRARGGRLRPRGEPRPLPARGPRAGLRVSEALAHAGMEAHAGRASARSRRAQQRV